MSAATVDATIPADPAKAAGSGEDPLRRRPRRTGSGSAQRLFRAIVRDRLTLAGLAIVAAVVVAGLLAPVFAAWTGHGPTDQYREAGLNAVGVPVGPGSGFLLGADGSGRDVFIRTLYGTQVSLLVGVPATTLALLAGTTLGLIAGFFGGRTDAVVSQIIDITLSFPFLVTALCLVALNRGDDGQNIVNPILVVILVITLFSWTFFARIVRGQVIALRNRPFVEAAVSIGASRTRIIVRDILPNVIPVALVYWGVQLPLNIVGEATLSFLGVGVVPPTPSWGNMISDAQASALYQSQPWMLLGPGIALVLTVLGFNLLSSGLQNILDPNRKR
ncbi:ABC transporter permease [Arthrobacter ginkgonis]|uniref:ABC transporter permease n=1 Tax=Arthrobacter ginkgonis TaxID=1630594 RepID=A0ABP7C7H2_9MICC